MQISIGMMRGDCHFQRNLAIRCCGILQIKGSFLAIGRCQRLSGLSVLKLIPFFGDQCSAKLFKSPHKLLTVDQSLSEFVSAMILGLLRVSVELVMPAWQSDRKQLATPLLLAAHC